MANSTALALVQQATTEMGLSVPSIVFTSTVQDTVQQRGLLNSVGYQLQREFDWQQITKEYRFVTVYYTYTGDVTSGSTSVTGMSSTTGLTTTPTYFSVTGSGIQSDTYLSAASGATATLTLPATASGTGVSLTFSQTLYVIPSDFDRLKDKTDWDKTKHWEMLGPETGQQWQWLKSGFISTGPRIRYRMLGGFFQIWPPAGIADYLGFEYLSKNWVLSSTASVTPDKAAFTLDTDTCIFPDRLMVEGLKHLYFQVKGFGDVYLPTFTRQLDIAKANDGGSPTLSMAPRLSEVLITQQNIPDSGYGV
jgi:hypothetical protein